MKYYDNGSGFSVLVPEDEVRDWADTWPCCNLSGDITFGFAGNGDLVDIYPSDTDGEGLDALCNDAKTFGLNHPHERVKRKQRS